MTTKRSFCQRLQDMFEANPNEWIETPLIAEVGGLSYTRRIYELRKTMNIENKVERQENGIFHSWYRWVKDGPVSSL